MRRLISAFVVRICQTDFLMTWLICHWYVDCLGLIIKILSAELNLWLVMELTKTWKVRLYVVYATCVIANLYASISCENFQHFLLFLLDRLFSLVFSFNNMEYTLFLILCGNCQKSILKKNTWFREYSIFVLRLCENVTFGSSCRDDNFVGMFSNLEKVCCYLSVPSVR